MSDRKVAIRLGTEGSAEVKNDLKAIGETGNQSFVGIGNAAEAAAKRAQQAFDRAAADAETARQRQANAAAKIAAITPQTSTQFQIGQSVGTGVADYEGSAKRSAAAFRELLAEQDRMEAKARAIKAALDPLAAAEDRYNQELEQTRRLEQAGLLTATEAEGQRRRLAQAIDAERRSLLQLNATNGEVRAGAQQLSFQIGDIATQFAAGTPPLLIFSQQSGQVVQAIGMMTRESKGLIGFLGGPWGQVITAGVILLGSLWTAHENAASGANAMKDAQSTLADYVDRTTGKIKEQNRALLLNAALTAQKAQADAEKSYLDQRKSLIARGDDQFLTGSPFAAPVQIRQDPEISSALGRYARGGSASQLASELEQIKKRNPRLKQDVDELIGMTAKVVEAARSYQTAASQVRLYTGDQQPGDEKRAFGEFGSDVKKTAENFTLLDARAKLAAGGLSAVERAQTELTQKREEYQKLVKDGKLTDAQYIEQLKPYETAVRAAEAAVKAEAQAKRDSSKAAREAAKEQRELEQAVKSITSKYDPATEAAAEYAKTVGQIAKLKAGGLVSDGQALKLETEALLDQSKKIQDATDKKLDERLQGSIRDPGALDSFPTRFATFGGKPIEATPEAVAKIKLLKDEFVDLRAVGTDALQSILDVERFQDFGRVGSIVLDTLKRKFLELALVNPLTNLLNAGQPGFQALPTLFGLFRGGHAAGTEYFGGGLAVVGEFGPELAALPRGSRITPASQTRRMLEAANDRGGSVFNFDLRGAVMTEDLLRQMNAIGDGAAIRGAAGGAVVGQAQLQRRARYRMA